MSVKSVHPDPPKRPAPPGVLFGVALSALAALAYQFLESTPWSLPTPDLICALAVIASVFTGGVSAGVASAIVILLVSAISFSLPDRPFQYAPEQARHLLALLIAMPLIVALVGVLKRRDERRLLKTAHAEQEHLLRRDTERDEDLKHTLSLLSATLDATADGILVVDLQGQITRFNRRFIEMWGIDEDIVAGRDDSRAIAYVLDQLSDPEGFYAKVRELYAQPSAVSHDVLRFKDGRVFERYSRPQAIAGEIVGRVWSFRDVSESRRAEAALRESEEQLRQAQKMEAVGRLAGGVAHDFNNLLTAILGNSSLMVETLREGDPQRVYALEIQQAAERASALTRQLLAFSRKQLLELKVLDLNAVVADTTSMLERLIGENIALEVKLDPSLGRVKVDPGQMTQVLLNLAVNARDAMPAGGGLVIETANVEVDAAFASRHSPLVPGSYVQLVVGDTGTGMDEKTMGSIFEPFFTTKERGKGTGLGLATVYGIVRQSDGYIVVASRPGHGATFRIYLPRVNEPLDTAASASSPASTRGDETVLLAEDEPSVRQLAHDALVEQGYRVLEAASGSEALVVAATHRGPLHALVTDVVMPGMGGAELAERLLSVRAGLRVIFISGYAADAGGTGLRRGDGFLQKPFSRGELILKLREVLDA